MPVNLAPNTLKVKIKLQPDKTQIRAMIVSIVKALPWLGHAKGALMVTPKIMPKIMPLGVC